LGAEKKIQERARPPKGGVSTSARAREERGTNDRGLVGKGTKKFTWVLCGVRKKRTAEKLSERTSNCCMDGSLGETGTDSRITGSKGGKKKNTKRIKDSNLWSPRKGEVESAIDEGKARWIGEVQRRSENISKRKH